jgi:hypothetical protein
LAPLPFYPRTGSIVAWALRQDALAAVSLQGISDSFHTFLASKQHQVLAYHYTRDGLEEYPGHNPDLQYNYEARFANGLSIYLNLVLPRVADQSPDWTKRGFDHSPLERILDLAASHGTRVIAFIGPYHALLMEAFRRKGVWPVFEQWKRELVSVFDNARATHPAGDIALWDFSGYNSATTEPLPRSGGKRSVMDYWDEVHYSINLGDRISAVLFRPPAADQTPVGDFGTKLTGSNIEAHLAAVRADQLTYEAAHVNDLKWLATLDKSAVQSTDTK